MHLKDVLKSVGETAKSISPYLDNGGCGVFAAAVAKELWKLGIPFNIVSAAPTSVTTTALDTVRSLCNSNVKSQWSDNGATFWHVGLQVYIDGEWFSFDSTGLQSNTEKLGALDVKSGYWTLDEMMAFADEEEGWNSCFDRREIPRIERMIEKAFSSLDPLTFNNNQRTIASCTTLSFATNTSHRLSKRNSIASRSVLREISEEVAWSAFA